MKKSADPFMTALTMSLITCIFLVYSGYHAKIDVANKTFYFGSEDPHQSVENTVDNNAVKKTDLTHDDNT